MSIRGEALHFLSERFGVQGGAVYSSKLYAPEESRTGRYAWWFEVSRARLEDRRVRYIRLLARESRSGSAFHYLRVPKDYFDEMRDRLEWSERAVRLHLSAEADNLFEDERSDGRVPFAQFLVEPEHVVVGAPNEPGERSYRVYVIELRTDACIVRPDPGLPPVYVGQTAHPPEKRFAQHRAGGRLAASKPHLYGVRLRPDLYEGLPVFPTRGAAEAAEAKLASVLEKRGYRVFWG